MDLLNAFNHPNFQVSSGNAGPDFMGAPNEGTITINTTTGARTYAPISASEYDTWAGLNAQPLSSTSAGAAQLTAIQNMVNGNRLSTGALPVNFWSVPVPQGFATKDPNTFDIRTLNGFKLYRLRQTYSTSFGQLRELGQPRYIQFGFKIVF